MCKSEDAEYYTYLERSNIKHLQIYNNIRIPLLNSSAGVRTILLDFGNPVSKDYSGFLLDSEGSRKACKENSLSIPRNCSDLV